jgi:hypothetical protein
MAMSETIVLETAPVKERARPSSDAWIQASAPKQLWVGFAGQQFVCEAGGLYAFPKRRPSLTDLLAESQVWQQATADAFWAFEDLAAGGGA